MSTNKEKIIDNCYEVLTEAYEKSVFSLKLLHTQQLLDEAKEFRQKIGDIEEIFATY